MRMNRASNAKLPKLASKAWLILAIGVAVCILAVAIPLYYFADTAAHERNATQTDSAAQPARDTPTPEDDTRPLKLTIAGKSVTAGEFRYALGEVTSTVIANCSNGEASIGSDFWRSNKAKCAPETSPTPRSDSDRTQAPLTTSYSTASKKLCVSTERPKERAICKAIRLLEQQHAVYQQAVAGGQMKIGSWEEVVNEVRETNSTNESTQSAGQTVYGISGYELPVFISKYMSQLRDAYIHTDTAPRMNVTDDAVRQHYRENTWDFGPQIESLTSESDRWNAISASVKEDLRTEIYYNLLAARVQNMDIVADQSSLMAFTEDALRN